MELVQLRDHVTLELLAYLRFEDGWAGRQGGLTTEPEDTI